jgi:hypothetical protein
MEEMLEITALALHLAGEVEPRGAGARPHSSAPCDSEGGRIPATIPPLNGRKPVPAASSDRNIQVLFPYHRIITGMGD